MDKKIKWKKAQSFKSLVSAKKLTEQLTWDFFRKSTIKKEGNLFVVYYN